MRARHHVLLVAPFGEAAARAARWVRQLGFRATRLQLGRDALAALRSGAFDVVLLYFSLPDMTGAELLERKARDPRSASIPTILAWGDDRDVEACRSLSSANAVARLRLPLDFDALAGVLDVAVGPLTRPSRLRLP